jgi:hypothetical protein
MVVLVNFGCDVGLFVVDSNLRRKREKRDFGSARKILGGLISNFLLQFGTNGWVTSLKT